MPASMKRADAARAPKRDSVVNLRLSAATRDLIDSAAAAAGKSRTEFMIESARQQATDVLLNHRLFELDEATYASFVSVLDNPPAPTGRLKTLFKQKAPWEA